MAEAQNPDPVPGENVAADSADAIFANASFDPPTEAHAESTADTAGMTDALADAQASIDELLKTANFEDPTGALPAAPLSSFRNAGAPVKPAQLPPVPLPSTAGFELPNFQQVMQDVQVSSIDLLRDVDLDVKIELGRTRMLVEDVLKLSEGSVVELDKLAGDPVDVFVNDRLVARGEVLVLNDNFCVRVNEIVAGVKDEGL